MLYSQLLKNRKSVRNYKNKKIENDKLDSLVSYSKKLEGKYDDSIKVSFYENGEHIYKLLKGVAGYNGVMIESPHYVGVQVKEENVTTIINTAYILEGLMSESLKMDIGSCWISLEDVPEDIKKTLLNDGYNEINYLCALGYEKDKKIFSSTPSSSRFRINDIVYKDVIGNDIDLDELKYRGLDELFYNIINAPSNKNAQPWRFIVKGNKILLSIKEINKSNLIDAGIIMYYFEGMAHDLRFNSTWNINNFKLNESNETKNLTIAEYDI